MSIIFLKQNVSVISHLTVIQQDDKDNSRQSASVVGVEQKKDFFFFI